MAKRVKCNGCKEYTDKADAIFNGVSYFCDWDCVYKKQNQKPAKAKNKSATKPKKPKLSTDFSTETRERILRGDRYRCRLCGKKSGNLAVHHIHYRSEKIPIEDLTSPYNGVTLCNEPCHLGIVHGNKRKYQPLLIELARKREDEGDWQTLIGTE